MTDHELLELAAKAAGIKIDKSPYNGGGLANDGFDVVGNAVLDWHSGTKWNPLKDDGDALRLAVKLNIPVIPYDDETSTATAGVVAKNWGSKEENTRRAIVRAAAEIGKAM